LIRDNCIARIESSQEEKANKMNQEIINLANALGLVVASVWDGYSRKWIVSERDGYYPIFTTNEYDRLIEGLRNGGHFNSL